MKTKNLLYIFVSFIASAVLFTAKAQFSTVEETVEYINERLSHSMVLKVDQKGLVKIKAPDNYITFNLKDVSFNYNASNGDNRIRVYCDDCIQYYDNKILENTESIQSFLCESKKAAMEVINAFKHLKKNYSNNSSYSKQNDKKIKSNDNSISYSTINDAVDFINDRLAFSVVSKVDENGVLYITAPDRTFKVNLKYAEFGYNASGGDTRVRIYGDFCIKSYDKNEPDELLARQSFSASSKNKAFDIIKALYFIKYAYLGQDVSKINSLRNVSGTKNQNYSTISEAIDFINDRLEISIIMDVNKSGEVTINAQESIYRFNIKDVNFKKSVSFYSSGNILKNLFFKDGKEEATGVKIAAHNGIRKYTDGKIDETMDEQEFSCYGEYRVKEVIKALRFIQDSCKK